MAGNLKINKHTGSPINIKLDIPDEWNLQPAPDNWVEIWSKLMDGISTPLTITNSYGVWGFYGWYDEQNKIVNPYDMLNSTAILSTKPCPVPHLGDEIEKMQQELHSIDKLKAENEQLKLLISELESENKFFREQKGAKPTDEILEAFRIDTEKAVDKMGAQICEYLAGHPIQGFIHESKVDELLASLTSIVNRCADTEAANIARMALATYKKVSL